MTEQELRLLLGQAIEEVSEMYRKLIKSLAKLAGPERGSFFECAIGSVEDAQWHVCRGLQLIPDDSVVEAGG